MPSSITLGFGPRMPDWGSWQWAGADVRDELAKYFRTVTFSDDQIPECDVLLFIKHAPPLDLMAQASRRSAVIYCPIDFYGSTAHIDADGPMLRRCVRILVHCERLRKYFEPYAPVEYIDHHVKFAAPLSEGRGQEPFAGTARRVLRTKGSSPPGFILWVGVRTNLPALVEWVNEHPLPCELRLLTNLEDPARVPTPEELGFRIGPHPNPLPASGEREHPRGAGVVIENWSTERQIRLTVMARAAIDIKGDDFRSRHKPPAKGIDFIASGVPLAMNPESSTVEHLARMGFEVVSPLDTKRWFSREYWEETRRFGAALRELLSLQRIGLRYKRIIEEVMAERRG